MCVCVCVCKQYIYVCAIITMTFLHIQYYTVTVVHAIRNTKSHHIRSRK